MAKNKSARDTPAPTFQPPQGRCRPFLGCAVLVISLLLMVALADFREGQTETTDPSSENLVGLYGARTAFYSFYTLGGAAWLLPVFGFWMTFLFFRRARRVGFEKVLAILVCLISAAGLLSMQGTLFTVDGIHSMGPGGLLGQALYEGLFRDNLGVFGTALILCITFGLGLLLVLTRNLSRAFEEFFARFERWRAARAEEAARRREMRAAEKEARARLKAQQKKEKELGGNPVDELPPPPRKVALVKPAPAPADEEASPPPPPPKPSPSNLSLPKKDPTLSLRIVESARPEKGDRKQLPKKAGGYFFPPIDLLEKPTPPSADSSAENHEETAETLIRTLSEFGVEVTMGEVHTGPVITRYEVYPAAGVRVERILGLDKNIALALKAHAVRIIAPVPGKGCVGVEVPNRKPSPVCIRDIIESKDWVDSHAEIPIALGKDVSGKPLIADLTRMPHLLIAGATGSGKTVCINSIITSLLYHSSPEDLRFIMVDPKIVEMKIFNDLPHMLIPVVTEPKKVPGALKWLLNEMERRYQIFAKLGVRNITAFNDKQKKTSERKSAGNGREEDNEALAEDEFGNIPEAVAPAVEVPRDEELTIPEKLPYIVAIIDELADIMVVAPAEVESGIARLAQLARAAGIHLVIATQRPSVNVITGVIKANLPSRIAFQVASKVDSRTILDGSGAEQLIGRGDMLFSPPGTSRLVRSQGAFVSDDEIAKIVESLKRNGPPQFAEEVWKQIESGGEEENGGVDDEDDEMLSDAIEVLRTTSRASTSMLQRRLRIGYNRAARLMEIMEHRGIVGPENGSSPREILVDLNSLGRD